MAVLEAINITKEYSNGVSPIKDYSVRFEEGTFNCIMGPSGAGKSTLLNVLGMLDKPTKGDVMLNGENIKDLKENELADVRMKNIGFIFQAFYLNQNLNALDNVIIPMLINEKYGKNHIDMKKAAHELLERFGLSDREKHYPTELSGGEQQRVAIARAMANDPTIIFADEPTGNLDEKNEQIIFKYLRELADEGKIVIVVSHNNNIKDYADNIIELKKNA